MQIDLNKPRPRHVWIGLDPEDDTIGFWQPVEFENVPPYCEYCKHQRHDMDECKYKLRYGEYKQRNEKEREKKNRNKDSNKAKEQEDIKNKSKENREKQQQGMDNNRKKQAEQQKEEEWKT